VLIVMMDRLLCLLLSLGPAQETGPAPDPKGLEFFERRIRPVLIEHCYACHSADAPKLKGALRVDTREGLAKGGNMGAAVVPGNPDRSTLVMAVRYHDEDIAMPPKKRLPEAVVADLEAWVRMGAPDPRSASGPAKGPVPIAPDQLWSFRPVADPLPPAVKDPAAVRNGVDAFLQARIEAAGLRPAPEADRRALLRRVTFDLTGLPPAPEETEAFLADRAPGAFARVVDRLLASPRYGERWGRHWLDVVRYGDTSGDGADWPIPEAYRYRDYVIEAFNQDLPYDRFLLEQIAGDKLAFADPSERFVERIVATGFIALSRRFNNSKYGDMHLVIENTLDTIGKGLLGMSIGCARCHDHKFDPISKEDYYGLYGYFASTQYPHAGTEHGRGQDNLVPLTPDLRAFDEARAWMNRWHELYNGWRKDGKKENEAKIKELEKSRPDVPYAWAVVDAKTPADVQVQLMGDPGKRGDRVPRGFLRALRAELPSIPSGDSGRLELARWIASKDNPLTARVMVNRIWRQHFGEGLVPTTNVFGAQGRRPTHPELLDWLASRFVESGWSVKAMHRLILNSAAYARASDGAPEAAAKDPANELLARAHRRRLEGEAIRDAMLAVSGTLEGTIGGPHPFPPRLEMNWTQHRPFAADYEHRRRSVYLMTRRLGKPPFMTLFDGPDGNVSTGERQVSTVALQALFLMNSPFVREASEGLAERLREVPGDDAARIRAAWRLAYGREPGDGELAESKAYLDAYREGVLKRKIAGDPDALAWSSLARTLLSSSEFIYLD
jgi:hypothetical protein